MDWKQTLLGSVGGLLNVGFISDTDYLIVVSHNGRGIFECSSGKKVARDHGDYWEFFNEKTGIVDGFDFLSDKKFKQADCLLAIVSLRKQKTAGTYKK